MTKSVKIIVIIVMIVVGSLAIMALKFSAGDKSNGSGIVGLIILLPLYAGIKAVWKYDSKDEKHKLNKD